MAEKQSDNEEEQQQQEETLASPGVVDKYKEAGKAANAALEQLIPLCVPGKNIVELCCFGDTLIEKLLAKIYIKKKIEKGIAFPVCISVNEICGHFSPLKGDSTILQQGDVAKIDLGVHIDGYIAQVAHTIVVGAPDLVKDRQADVILCCYQALQAAFRKFKPGFTNYDVTETVQKVADAYHCNPCEGVLSHELKKHLIDGNNVIINKETFEQKVEEHEFQINEVYTFDVMISSGEGKPKESDFRTSVYKKNMELSYKLKQKAARSFLSEVNNKYPTLCFSLNSFEDEIQAKIGVKECLEHGLLDGYPVLTEKKGAFVAQFKATILILNGGTQAITGLPLDESKFKSEFGIDDKEIKELLTTSMDKKSQKQMKKKNKKAGDKQPEEVKKQE